MTTRFKVGDPVRVKDTATMYAEHRASPPSAHVGERGQVIAIGVDPPGSEGYDYRVILDSWPTRESDYAADAGLRGLGFMEYELEEA